jgi:hypothetical protein
MWNAPAVSKNVMTAAARFFFLRRARAGGPRPLPRRSAQYWLITSFLAAPWGSIRSEIETTAAANTAIILRKMQHVWHRSKESLAKGYCTRKVKFEIAKNTSQKLKIHIGMDLAQMIGKIPVISFCNKRRREEFFFNSLEIQAGMWNGGNKVLQLYCQIWANNFLWQAIFFLNLGPEFLTYL